MRENGWILTYIRHSLLAAVVSVASFIAQVVKLTLQCLDLVLHLAALAGQAVDGCVQVGQAVALVVQVVLSGLAASLRLNLKISLIQSIIKKQ